MDPARFLFLGSLSRDESPEEAAEAHDATPWAYELPVPADQVKRAWVVIGDGQVLASATLAR